MIRFLVCVIQYLFHHLLKVSIAFSLHVFIWDETQGCAVDAVAHAVGRVGIPVKYMAQVGIAGSAPHFNPL